MGLDDVELYMDLEDHFKVPFNPARDEYDGTIGDIVRIILKSYNPKSFADLRRSIMNWPLLDEDAISKEEYNKIAHATLLPTSGRIFKREWPHKRSEVLEMFDRMVANIDFTADVEKAVISLAKERLCYKGHVTAKTHLYRDMGAG